MRSRIAGVVLVFLFLTGTAQPARLAERPLPDPFLSDLHERTFRWFWDKTNSRNGLTPDRTPNPAFASIAAVGFALTAYPVGIERGYISRAQGAERVLTTLRFFWHAPQGPGSSGVTGHKGFFYHFLDVNTGHRYRTTELSTIDTALLMAGALFCQSYFDRPEENEIRSLADVLYHRVEWDWIQPRKPLVSMGWTPEKGFIGQDYRGYNEAMILYLLALGSPTHPISADAWQAFTSTYTWDDAFGCPHVNFSPLFGHQYSHVWVDFRAIVDPYMREKGIDYFENSRRATYANRQYCIQNPAGWEDYGEHIWGLTACDGPAGLEATLNNKPVRFRTYWARGASGKEICDDGTLAPTAAGGSIPFAPEIAVPALKAMRDRYGDLIYNQYGFVDAFNPTFKFAGAVANKGVVDPQYGWFDSDQLGIDQGPIVLMIENYCSGFVWEVMKRNKYLVRGLCRARFSGGWLEGRRGQTPEKGRKLTPQFSVSEARRASALGSYRRVSLTSLRNRKLKVTKKDGKGIDRDLKRGVN